jgi:Mn2+/Fe2+ NRAMP family transporter
VTEQRLPPAARSASWRPEKSRARARPILVVLLVALIVANALNISADLVAVGSGMNLLHAGPTWVWALVAGVLITVLVIVGSFVQIARVFKLICLALFSYFAVMFSVHVNWGQVGLHTVVPHLEVVQQGLPGAAGRGAGHHHQPVPVLLAIRTPAGRTTD